MSVPPEVIARARAMLQQATRPVVFHDNDPDGCVSFVLLNQFCHEGRSVPVKNKPQVDESFLSKIEEHGPDLVVILDTSRVSEEFLSAIHTPILWVDHHEPPKDVLARHPNILMVNPRLWDDTDNRPTSYWLYQITGLNLWLATVGCVADWHIPDFLPEFQERFTDLLPATFSRVEDLYLDTPIGVLIRVIQFNLKGATADVRKAIMTLVKIESPYEILMQSTSRGRLLWRRYEAHLAGYQAVLKEATGQVPDGHVHLFVYEGGDQTYTVELSNELLIRYPDRITLICRKHEGKRKCSLRSRKLELPSIVTEALKGCSGHGGGHTNACGAVVREEDWEKFYTKFRDLVNARI